MPGPGIRDANPADLEALIALEQTAFPGDRLSRRSLRQLMRRPTASLRVAASGGRVLGYALVLFRRTAAVARLYSIAVTGNDRGSGVGARLLADAERQARRRADRLRLEVRTDNKIAIAFYERRGYRRIGRFAGYYSDGRDALRFEKVMNAEKGSHRQKRRRSAARRSGRED